MTCHLIKMSEFKVADGKDSLITSSLGSCVGVLLYDKELKIGGMAHIMLPKAPIDDNHIGRYADKAIPELIHQMMKNGSSLSHINAMLIGGADMFYLMNLHSLMKIGLRNIEEARVQLNEWNIPIIHEEIGGMKGRSVKLECEYGIVTLQDFDSRKQVIHF